MATADKLITVAENVPKVYHAGQMNIVKNAECLKGTKSDTAMLIDDVSPVEHEMGVKVRGKNLLNLSNREIVTNTWSPNTDMRNFNGNQLFVGISANNYFITPNIVSYSIGETIKVTAIQAAYGLGYDVAVEPNTSYVFSSITTNGEIRAGLYNKDGTFSRMIDAVSTFTTKSTEYWAVVVLKQLAGNESIEASFSNIQLELGATATSYTPYVPDLTVVKVTRQGKNLFSGLTKGIGIDLTTIVEIVNSNYSATDYIPVDFNANTYYYISGLPSTISNCIFAYNANKEFLGRTGGNPLAERKLANRSFVNGTPQGEGDIAYLRVTCFKISTSAGTVDDIDDAKIQLEIGSTATDYEPYNSAEYAANADGTVEGVTSLYPVTQIMTDTDGVIIYCNYYKDVDKAFNELTTSVALSGGDS